MAEVVGGSSAEPGCGSRTWGSHSTQAALIQPPYIPGFGGSNRETPALAGHLSIQQWLFWQCRQTSWASHGDLSSAAGCRAFPWPVFVFREMGISVEETMMESQNGLGWEGP